MTETDTDSSGVDEIYPVYFMLGVSQAQMSDMTGIAHPTVSSRIDDAGMHTSPHTKNEALNNGDEIASLLGEEVASRVQTQLEQNYSMREIKRAVVFGDLEEFIQHIVENSIRSYISEVVEDGSW